jgi:hypothetical protein
MSIRPYEIVIHKIDKIWNRNMIQKDLSCYKLGIIWLYLIIYDDIWLIDDSWEFIKINHFLWQINWQYDKPWKKKIFDLYKKRKL